MTTSRVFGINPAGPPTNPSPTPVDNSAEKFKLLSEAIDKLLKKQITKDEFQVIQTALNTVE